MTKETRYIQVAANQDIKDEVASLASSERRSIAEQGGVIFEIGLKEYRRREAEREALLAGQTQFDLPTTDEERAAMLERVR